MPRWKIAISPGEGTLKRLDHLVRQAVIPNCAQTIQAVVEEKLARLERRRLAQECAKHEAAFEKALAGDGMSEVLTSWPEGWEERSGGANLNPVRGREHHEVV